eukprot:5436924-Pleurochrysis_carterae.AAC.2
MVFTIYVACLLLKHSRAYAEGIMKAYMLTKSRLYLDWGDTELLFEASIRQPNNTWRELVHQT